MQYDLLKVLNNIAKGYRLDLKPFKNGLVSGLGSNVSNERIHEYPSIFAHGKGITIRISREQGLWYCESERHPTFPTDRGEIEQGVIGPDPITAFLCWLDEKRYAFPSDGFL
jgi:hypothetical protein